MARVVIAYIPGLHQGYVNFFAQYPGRLYVLGSPYLQQVPRLDRDIRALAPGLVAQMVEVSGLMSPVRVLDDVALLNDLSASDEVVMPDEEVSRRFAAEYVPNRNVTFVSTFLRWDRQISTTELVVPPDRVVTREAAHQELLRTAQQVATSSPDWWRQVGALAVRDGEILLSGFNRPLVAAEYTLNVFGDPRSNFDYGEFIELGKSIHAEASLIAEAARRGLSLEGAEIFVTTFPCPNCARLLAVAGFKRVFYHKGYSLLDAEDILRAHAIEIVLIQQDA